MQNNGSYGMEVQEYFIDMSLKDIDVWEIDDRIWMQKNMQFKTIDLQKHSKTNHFRRGVA